ncbi:MAG: MMPL family transporter [Chromatiales bacterium]
MSLHTWVHDRADHLIDAWFHYLQRHAWPVIVLALTAALFCANYTINHIRINTDNSDMLSEKLPWRQTYIQYKKAFPQYADNIVIVIDGASPDEAHDAADRLATHLRTRTDLFKSVYFPRASQFLRENGLLYLDEPELQELADNLARVQPFLARLAADQSLRGLANLLTEALTEQEAQDIDLNFAFTRIAATLKAHLAGRHARLSWEALMSGKDADADDRRVLVVTQPNLDFNSVLPGETAIAAIRNAAEQLKLTPEQGVRMRLTGGAALSYDELKSASLGAQLASIGAFIMVALVMIIGLRSLWLMLTTLTALVMGLIFTAFFATVTIGELNLISVAFAVMYIGLGADYAIYLCLRYKELAADADDHREALTRAARHVGGSLGLCTLTTSVGFFAFIPTSYKGVAELGIISGAGMFISLFVTLAILPALLTLKVPQQRHLPGVHHLRYAYERLLTLPLRHNRAIIVGAVAAAAAALLVLPHASFDYNPLNLQDPKAESVVAYKDLLAHDGQSPWSIVALIREKRELRRLQEQLERLPTVDKVVTVESLVPSDQEQKLAVIGDMSLTLGSDLSNAVPQPAPDAAQSIEALQKLAASLSVSLSSNGRRSGSSANDLLDALQDFLGRIETADSLEREKLLRGAQDSLLGLLPGRLAALADSLNAQPISLQSLPADLHSRWIAENGIYRIEVIPRENLDNAAAMRRFVREVRGVLPAATGSPIIYLEASDAVVSAFKQAFFYAFIAIAVLLWLSMDEKVDVVLVLAPLVLAAILTGAATVLLGIPFNFANIIALPLLLGMGVDNGIHMVHRFRTDPPKDGVLLHTSTATAIGLSALTNASGFGNLAVSPHTGTASMGIMLTVGILLTLLCTMIILPSLLNLLHSRANSAAT